MSTWREDTGRFLNNELEIIRRAVEMLNQDAQDQLAKEYCEEIKVAVSSIGATLSVFLNQPPRNQVGKRSS